MERLRRYGVAATIDKPLVDTSNDYVSGVTFAAGDVTICKDTGSAFSNITTLPTEIGSSGVYRFALSATEMECKRLIVKIIDQTATKVWVDDGFIIATGGHSSALLDGT